MPSDRFLQSAPPWLVVGLGNPGELHARNRHNAGYMVVDGLARRLGATFKTHRARAEVLEGSLNDIRVVCAKPRTFMNEAGGPVALLRRFFDVPLDRLVVVHDELDIDFGLLRVKFGGGDNGHNGLRSITKSVGGAGYVRLRFGIGRPPGRMDPASFVLSNFSATERSAVAGGVERAGDVIESLLQRGIAATQTLVNGQ